jgi:SAM-dependent methyltransferase
LELFPAASGAAARQERFMAEIDRGEGRRAFGGDPAGYDRARPGYPPEVYRLLRERCGLRPGTRTFEVGPGTGQATRELLRLGAHPLVAVEPDERLAGYLAAALGTAAGGLDVKVTAFEDAGLPEGWFDLGVAATVFHWLDQGPMLRKAARLLRPGGWWAMWWNLFGDPSRRDQFHEATQDLLANLDWGPSAGPRGRPPFALDVEERLADLAATGEFDDVAGEVIRWSATFDTEQVRGLYATFSPISRLGPAERQRLLEDLGRIAEDQFGGRVERPMATPVYTARRR